MRAKYAPDEPRPCRDCGETKPADDFHGKERHPDGSIKTRQSYCKPCGRIRDRKRYQPIERKSALPHEEVLRRKRERYAQRMEDPQERRKHRRQSRKAMRKRRRKAKKDPAIRQALQQAQRRWYLNLPPERRAAYLARQVENAKRNGSNQRRWERIKSDPQLHADHLINRRIINRDKKGSTRPASNAIEAFRLEYQSLDADPFRKWLQDTYPTLNVMDLAAEIGIAERQVRDLLHYNAPRVTMRLVDRALTTIGRPDILNELYPLEEAA